MQPLSDDLRRDLEKTIRKAREAADDAAKAALSPLGVGEAAPYSTMTDAQKDLRRRLRIHGRQLGDVRDAGTEKQETTRLLEEVAYEHWHRMLFARFLAENILLMYPDPSGPIPVTLEECDELAADEGARDGWELAARFAARMLPQIFRPDSPVFELVLSPEHQQTLERLVAGLPTEVFMASDSLGWVYQFWQSKRQEEVNASEVKIGARELPAVTQLFTEPYMVNFLLDNSLGAWWAVRRLSANDLREAETEAELRTKAALPGVPFDYLRFVRGEDGAWTPAAGTFEAWPKHLSELKTLDPCCGSGHFLVAALLMLAPMREVLEGLSPQEAIDLVLRQNLHGLELDQRCVEIAAFALALTAWRYAGYRPLPELNLACSGLSVKAARSEWKSLAYGKRNLEFGLNRLYELFENAPVLGSLINPARVGTELIAQWSELREAFSAALSHEREDERQAAGVVAQGMTKAAALLAEKYYWVITNVPYLARGKQDSVLQSFIELYHGAAKADLATAFLDRCLDFCTIGGTASIVLPQNWMFLISYASFRRKLLQKEKWHLIARLGPRAFETINGEVVKAILITLSHGIQTVSGGLFEVTRHQKISGIDVSQQRTPRDKAAYLRTAQIDIVPQTDQLKNPDAIVKFTDSQQMPLLMEYAHCHQGTSTGDNPRFVRCFWEVKQMMYGYELLESVADETSLYSGKCNIINWKEVRKFEASAVRGWEAFGRAGVSVGQMTNLPATLFLGYKFPNTTPVIVPYDNKNLSAIWVFCSSKTFKTELRKINQKLSVDNGYIGKIPFDLNYWVKVAEELYPDGIPKPYSSDPTQWVFHGHPIASNHPLQVALSRLLGYRWPGELDARIEFSDQAQFLIEKSRFLLAYADEDGIVCIPSVRGEPSAVDRLLDMLAAAYGEAWSNDVLSDLLKQADHAGKTLDTWLRDKFFTQHCQLFHQRPFVWHIWDGLRDGFAALVNYHKLDHKLLETLTYTYLGDWIKRQKEDKANGVDGAGERCNKAEILQSQLKLILDGETPHDIFVRWKPIAEQPVGWNPDLNDGVRLNIRPFMTVSDVGKKGAGILRDKPNIDWGKDRGKDVSSALWYHVFNGERINDHHLTIAEKQAARAVKKSP